MSANADPRKAERQYGWKAAGKVVFFTLLPTLPILITVIITNTFINSEFAARHLDLLTATGPDASEYKKLTSAVADVKTHLETVQQALATFVEVKKKNAKATTAEEDAAITPTETAPAQNGADDESEPAAAEQAPDLGAGAAVRQNPIPTELHELLAEQLAAAQAQAAAAKAFAEAVAAAEESAKAQAVATGVPTDAANRLDTDEEQHGAALAHIAAAAEQLLAAKEITDAAKRKVDAAKASEDRPSATAMDELAGAEKQLAVAANALLDAAAQLSVDAPALDGRWPIGRAKKDEAVALRSVVAATVVRYESAEAQLAQCECPQSVQSIVGGAITRLKADLPRIESLYPLWGGVKSQHPKAVIRAVTATVILLVVACGAAFWCCMFLLPDSSGGTRFGGLALLRWAAIGASIAVFVAVTVILQAFPLMPFGVVNTWMFERTFGLSLGDNAQRFMLWNYAGIGLVASALLAAFATMAVAAGTYRYNSPPVKAINATDRVNIVRTVLYVAAALSVVAMLTIDSDYNVAVSMFAEKIPVDVANPTRVLIAEMGSVIMQGLGIALGLALAASYLPAANHLNRAYRKENPGSTATSSFPFFTAESSGKFMRFLAFLAPSLAATVTTILG